MNYFLVGQIKGNNWEFQGMMSNVEKAIKACINENYFYAPVEIDKVLPDRTVGFPGIIYPKK